MLPYGPEGCTRSHVEVAKLAKQLFPHDSYLVFEDDCVLSDGWDTIYKAHPTADIVYLGYNDMCEHTIFGTHALLISPKARDLFLQQWQTIGEKVQNRMATDWILSRLIRDNKLYVVLPDKQTKELAMQKKGLVSLITKSVRT
jgi:GR25 family glycosyltransferase involved in LPS biosynthesis